MNNCTRATGRTTRTLNKLITIMISRDVKPRRVTLIAATDAYAQEMLNRVHMALRALGCADIFTFTKTSAVGNRCTVRCLGQQRYSSHQRQIDSTSTTVLQDHTGNTNGI